MIGLLLMWQLATWERAQPPVLHQGTYQSCGDEERALDHTVIAPGSPRTRVIQFSVHMGPSDEFALYAGRGPEGEHSHNDPLNLLMPAYHIHDLDTMRGARQWGIPSLRLWLSIVRAGGSLDDCQNFYIRIESR